MSSIKTTQIDGDISVGRNVAMGGKAEVAGNLTVGHTLLVKGWLDAPNIKGANKGVFITLDELEEAYPEPHAGWYAGVGTSSPFDLYVGRDGGWSSTGGTMTIDTDLTIFENILEEVLSNRGLSGFVVKQSINDLPSVPDIPSLGYLVDGHLYVFVGTDGDTLDGLYQDCGALEGPAGRQGPKGNDAVVLEGVSLADSMEAVKNAASPSNTVPTANAVKETDEAINGVPAKTKTRSTSSSARVYIYASDFGLTYFPKGLQLTFLLGGAASSATLYSTKSDETTANLGNISNGTNKTITVASEDITSYYAYKSSTGKSLTCTVPATGGLRAEFQSAEEAIEELGTRMTNVENMLQDQVVSLRKTIDMSSTVKRIEITKKEGGFEEGDTISVHLGDGLSSYYARLYYFYSDGSSSVIQNATKQDWDGLLISAPAGKTFSKLRFWFVSLTGSTNPTINVDVIRSASIYQTLDEMREDIAAATPTDIKAVILGDSYSQMGRWVTSLRKIINFSQLNNLGVGGANLKDIYGWKNYPYTDRPYQTKVMPNGVERNYNVINCQMEWLKRLVNNQCRGVYYEIAFTSATADGSFAVSVGGTTYTVAVTSGQTAAQIAESVAALEIDGYTLIHPTGTNYVTFEALSPEETEVGTVSASGTTATATKIRSAEAPIYQDGDYPDFIIVEAGKNDAPDTDEVVAEYMSSVLVKTAEGYVKKTSSSSVERGTVYLPKPKDEVNRMTFCGELSYLVREVYELFPRTILIVVGPSSLKGGNSGLANEIKKDDQMRLACRYLNIPYVSWIDDGIVNRVINYPSGSGTPNDPWVYNCATYETTDMLHPNDRGGMKLALAVAQKIRELISYRTLIKDY